MSLCSKQKWFCNACGQEQFSPIPNAIGGKYTGALVCSMTCLQEFKWREILSIMGKEYYPRKQES